MITWIHVPEQRDKMLPEQWQARAGEPLRSVAVLRCDWHMPQCVREWQAVLQSPDGTLCSVVMTGVTEQQARANLNEDLKNLGWR